MYRWQLVEHTGTHMDAPIHFGDGVQSADQIPIEHLVVPLAVVDIRAKAQDDADAQLTPEDLAGVRGRARPDPGRRLRRDAERLGRQGRRGRSSATPTATASCIFRASTSRPRST